MSPATILEQSAVQAIELKKRTPAFVRIAHAEFPPPMLPELVRTGPLNTAAANAVPSAEDAIEAKFLLPALVWKDQLAPPFVDT